MIALEAPELVGCESDYAARISVAPASRPGRALIAFSSGAVVSRHHHGHETLVVSPEAVDLSRLRSGRAPFLLDHCKLVDSVVGVIEDAWIDEGLGWAVARFARS